MTTQGTTKLGFASISAMDRPLEAAAAMAAGAGLDGLEVTARSPHFDPEGGAPAGRAAGRKVRDAGIEVIAYGSYLGRPGFSGPEHVEREVAIAEALETSLLRVWAEPSAPGDPDSAAVVQWLRQACDAAAPLGIDIVVERHIGSFADTPERIDRLFGDVDRPNLALNYQVLDFLPPDRASQQAADASRLISLARYFHLKNYRANPEEGGPLAPGGSLEGGVLDYPAILAAAWGAGYRGPMTFEFLSWEPKPAEEKLAADVAFVREQLRILSRGASAEPGLS